MVTGFRSATMCLLALAAVLAGCGQDARTWPETANPLPAAAVPAATSPAPALATAAAVTTVTTPPAATEPQQPTFAFSAHRLSKRVRDRVTGRSWHPGCPVPLRRLRYLRVGYWGFDREAHTGELIVASSSVKAMRRAFARLFEHRFPIRRMRLVDDYGGSDDRSIDADNTSAFNCRPATGSSRWSEHAYGRAIDVNPIENPYVYPDGTTVHRASRPYLDRSRHRRGMAVPGGVLVRAFAHAGWRWGGRWRAPQATDYQHFSRNGH